MKCTVIDRSFGLDSLRMVERDTPVPGPGEVLVRVRAASLNYRDLMTVKGHYNPRQPLPLIPLSDGAGDVAAVGSGVSSVKPGDRVIGTFFQHWEGGAMPEDARSSTLGGPIDGMLTEYALLREHGVVPAPAHLTDMEAAALPCAAVTAWNALVVQGSVKPGDVVLTEGTGGVSIFALQFAALAGARVIATSSSDEKLDKALALGASDGINYRNTPEWDRRVRELTGGRGADHVIEVGGAKTLPLALGSARTGGRVSIIGVLTGVTEQLSIIPILMNGLQVQGIFVGSRQMFRDMNRAIEAHNLKPVVDRVFGFSEAREALEFMESGRHFGKIGIEIP